MNRDIVSLVTLQGSMRAWYAMMAELQNQLAGVTDRYSEDDSRWADVANQAEELRYRIRDAADAIEKLLSLTNVLRLAMMEPADQASD